MDKSRIAYMIHEGNYDYRTVLWLIPPGAEMPDAAETGVLINAENMARELPKLFRKKLVK
jgi:hypothetical protein